MLVDGILLALFITIMIFRIALATHRGLQQVVQALMDGQGLHSMTAMIPTAHGVLVFLVNTLGWMSLLLLIRLPLLRMVQ